MLDRIDADCAAIGAASLGTAAEGLFRVVIAMELQQGVTQVGVRLYVLGIAGNRLAQLLDGV